MASDSQSTVFDVDKVDGRSYDKEASTETIVAQPTDFPDGGARAWMTLIGRFGHTKRIITVSDEGLQLLFSVLQHWVGLRYRFIGSIH
jgi:hypothetical protein